MISRTSSLAFNIAWLAVGISLCFLFAWHPAHTDQLRPGLFKAILLRFPLARFAVVAGPNICLLWFLNSKIETHTPFEDVGLIEKCKAVGGIVVAAGIGAIGSLCTLVLVIFVLP